MFAFAFALLISIHVAIAGEPNGRHLVLELSDASAENACLDSTDLPLGLTHLYLPDASLKQMFWEPHSPLHERIWHDLHMNRWFVLKTVGDIDQIVQELQVTNELLCWHIQMPFEVASLPNDYDTPPEMVGGLWALRNVQCPQAWAIQHGNDSIIIATIDTGCDLYPEDEEVEPHPELLPNQWVNSGEDANRNGLAEFWSYNDPPPGFPPGDLDGVDGIADDIPENITNGQDDDLMGWDFVDDASNVYWQDDADEEDNQVWPDVASHGTSVASMANAVTNNDVGVSSPAWNVRHMPLKAGYLNSQGDLGIVDALASCRAIYYAMLNGANIVSLSWSLPQDDPAIAEALQAAQLAGVLCIVAAGNTGNSSPQFPASLTSVVAVAALDDNDVKWGYSTYGSWIDISAPGGEQDGEVIPAWTAGSIWAWDHGYHGAPPDGWIQVGGYPYRNFSGTSSAAPHVSSIAALLWSFNLGLTATEIKTILLDSADPVDNLAGNDSFVDQLGSGRVNAFKAILRAPGKKVLIDDLAFTYEIFAGSSQNPASPYYLADDIVVPNGVNLTVEPGVELVMASGVEIVVEDGGELIIDGAVGYPVRLVATGTDPSDAWSGIHVMSSSANNRIENCVIENASVGIRTYADSYVSLDNCTFDGCGVAVAAVHGGEVVMTDCAVNDSRYYGLLSAARGQLNVTGGSVSNSERAGLWSASQARTFLDDVVLRHNGPDAVGSRTLNHGGIRNSFSNVKMHCVESSTNNGPGVSCFGGYMDMAPASTTTGKNTIQDNAAVNGGQTQIYFCQTVPDLCNGRNRICASDDSLISDCNPGADIVEGNYWCGNPAGRIPGTYDYLPLDDAAQEDRCPLNNLSNCMATEAAAWYDQGWTQENLMQWEEAKFSYKYVLENYPGSKEAKLCPDRIVFCEGMSGKQWSTQRWYFLQVADTTTDADLKVSSRASAAWCLVEMDSLEEAFTEFTDIMNQGGPEYKLQKVALDELLAELKYAPWDSIGFSRAQQGSQSMDEMVRRDPLLSVLDRMEAVLGGNLDRVPESVIPTAFALHQNYPNPFNPSTEFSFDLPEGSIVKLKVFDILGREVATVVDKYFDAGTHHFNWDSRSTGSTLASGVYIYQIKAGGFTDAKKMILLR